MSLLGAPWVAWLGSWVAVLAVREILRGAEVVLLCMVEGMVEKVMMVQVCMGDIGKPANTGSDPGPGGGGETLSHVIILKLDGSGEDAGGAGAAVFVVAGVLTETEQS